MKIWWCQEHKCSSERSIYTCHNNYSKNLCRLVPMYLISEDEGSRGQLAEVWGELSGLRHRIHELERRTETSDEKQQPNRQPVAT